jgi:hypothetical protein
VLAQDAGDDTARRLVDDVDETLPQFGVLPPFLLGVGHTLDIERSQCQEQPGPDVVAGTVGQSEQVFLVDCGRGHAVPHLSGFGVSGFEICACL